MQIAGFSVAFGSTYAVVQLTDEHSSRLWHELLGGSGGGGPPPPPPREICKIGLC